MYWLATEVAPAGLRPVVQRQPCADESLPTTWPCLHLCARVIAPAFVRPLAWLRPRHSARVGGRSAGMQSMPGL